MSSPKSKDLRCLDILQEIKNGVTDAASLSASQRKLLVPLLMSEGQSTAEIAHILKVSDRTIERDKLAIRKEKSIQKDPELLSIIIGRLVDEAQVSIQRIRKFQREKDCSPSAKIDAEYRCFQIECKLSERLQSLGYLPIASHKIEADLTHHLEKQLSLDEIQSEAERLRNIEKTLPITYRKHVKIKAIENNNHD